MFPDLVNTALEATKQIHHQSARPTAELSLPGLSGDNPEKIRPKVMKVRKDHEGRIKAILSEAQQKQWKKKLGKPFDLGD
jgi:hypothetical protein